VSGSLRSADATALAGIQRLVLEGDRRSNSRAQVLADRLRCVVFYRRDRRAVITFAAWTLAGDVEQAVTSTVTVLVIACPHALGSRSRS
jgi:Cu2+-exporting ATPase